MFEALPTPIPHKSFIKATPIQSCHYILELDPEEQCEFVESTPECAETVHYIDYIMLIFCDVGRFYGTILLCFWLLFLSGFVVVIAIRFYTNSALFLTRILGFSEYLGGTIIFCFGNSFNKLMSATTKGKSDTELFYNEMLGTATFLMTFIIGLIIIQDPFQMIEAPFMMISGFILAALAIIASVVHDDSIGLYEVALLLLLFVSFLSITIVVHRCMKKIYKKRLKLSDDIQNELVNDEIMAIITEVVQLKRISCEMDVEMQGTPFGRLSGWEMFVKYMIPINFEKYRNSGKFLKVLMWVQVPFYLVLLLLIPKVDYSAYERNWSKYNYLVAILTYPVVACFSLNVWDMPVIEIPDTGDIILIEIVFAISLLFAFLILVTSNARTAPRYFNVFVVYSYFVSIHLIYLILLEIISGLHAFGILCGLEHATIGGTFLAWANGLINISTNFALCRQKFKRMAITSTFVEAFFILTIGIGSIMLLRLLSHHEWTYPFRSGANGPTFLVFLFNIVIFNWITAFFTKYQARRSLGVFMIMSYLTIVIFMFLCEEQLLHPFGTDHINQIESLDNDMYRIN